MFFVFLNCYLEYMNCFHFFDGVHVFILYIVHLSTELSFLDIIIIILYFLSWYYQYKFFLHLKKALQWGTLILLSNQILYLNCCEIIQACGWWFFMGFVATPSPKYCILNELRNTVSIQYMCWHTNNMKVKSLRACENLTIHEIWPPQLSLIQQ